ncbi:hypothetical protein HYPSUDRAFT_215911 [Hypholoma sublateritium FD-334 SS-4]|uniref:Uncharacterized protein n=1 Tax=Hypholoma sublateritium (strain FD-334 SS-4) TaxID=945553 RepID=A0A0D2L5E2_HYPSF|nr:hypothetical protein HYPSUDRAFT_215911 [Hypholoma sublateritium FD-334 SS-4]
MFSFPRSQALTALTFLGLAVFTVAAPNPTAIMTRQVVLIDITVCTASDSCTILPAQTGIGGCTDLLDSFGFLFKEITAATIPEGLACFFYEDFECTTFTTDSIFLTSGTWDFAEVVTTDGVLGFDDQTSSLACATI